MSRKLAILSVGGGVLFCLLLWSRPKGTAQEVLYYPDVLLEVKHDVSPPLRDIPAVISASEAPDVLFLCGCRTRHGPFSLNPIPCSRPLRARW